VPDLAAASSRHVRRVDKTPSAVRDALDPELRAEFEAEFRAAMTTAVGTFDLGPVRELVERWWPEALIAHNPHLLDGVAEDVRRVKAGDPTVFAPLRR
jgi:hypothetical protein